MASAQRFSFPMIDVLRGFAAVSVIVYHVIEHFGWKSFPSSGPLVWFRVGWMGVDLFFVISGFVIALSAFGLMDRYGSSAFHRPFAEKRLLRIVPLHLVTCLLFLIAIRPELLFASGTTANVLSHVAFVHNMSMDWAGAINGPNWSVAVEMQFYLLILLTAPWLRSCRWWLIPLICMPMAWAWRYWAISTVPMHETLGPYPLFWLSTQLPGTLDQFAAGVLLARLVRGGGLDRISQFGRLQAVAITVVPATLMMAATFVFFWPNAGFWDVPSMILFWRTFAALSFASVLLAACTMNFRWMARWMAPFGYLGTVSYGLYLWHLLVIESVKRLEWVDGPRALPVVLVLTFLLAAGSWHLFEKSLMTRRLFKERGQARAD